MLNQTVKISLLFEQMDRLAEQLAGYYGQTGNWQFIAENRPVWHRLQVDISPPPPDDGRFANMERGNRFNAPFPAPREPRGLGQRVVLFDSNRNRIIGGPAETLKNLDQRPINLADPDRLQQLFTNLLENSLRYTDSPGTVSVKLKVGREFVHIHFQDTLPGVPSVQLPKIFDRLHRGEVSRNRETGGAGLGLSISKNIVDAHQGTIGAESSPQGGVWIKIKLPLIS